MPRTRVEYATDQITVYRSCPYACRYCWASLPLFKYRIGRGKYDCVEEAFKYGRLKKPRTIVISFTSDPYPPQESRNRVMYCVLNYLCRARQHKIMILTKNPALAIRDILDVQMNLKHPNFWLGTTVISLEATGWEPKAPPPTERLNALEFAHTSKGIVKTWISIEPIIPGTTDPFEIIRKTYRYTDWYVLGAFNYAYRFGFEKSDLKRYYELYIPEAIKLLESLGKPYLIKKELKRLLGES